jgi:hypothetical protein
VNLVIICQFCGDVEVQTPVVFYIIIQRWPVSSKGGQSHPKVASLIQIVWICSDWATTKVEEKVCGFDLARFGAASICVYQQKARKA